MWRSKDWNNPYQIPFSGTMTTNPDYIAHNVYEAGADAMLETIIRRGSELCTEHEFSEQQGEHNRFVCWECWKKLIKESQ